MTRKASVESMRIRLTGRESTQSSDFADFSRISSPGESWPNAANRRAKEAIGGVNN
jgi:hypothetical protein